MGSCYKLKIVDTQEVPLKFENEFYLSRNALPQARDAFTSWYKIWLMRKFQRELDGMQNKEVFKYKKSQHY